MSDALQRLRSRPTRQALRDARVELGLTQAGLGLALGLAHETVSRYETGRIPVPLVSYLAVEALLARKTS